MPTITLPPLKNTTADDFYYWLRDEVLHLRARRGDFATGDFYQVTMPHVSRKTFAEGQLITLRSDDAEAHSPPRVIPIQAVPMGQAVKLRFHSSEAGACFYLDVLLHRVREDFGIEHPQAETLTVVQVAHSEEEQPKGVSEPWEVIPDKGGHREAVKLWRAGYTAPEIELRIGSRPAAKTIHNRISDLRKIYGSEIVPYRRSMPRSGKKVGD
jgi:hypothetical protein